MVGAERRLRPRARSQTAVAVSECIADLLVRSSGRYLTRYRARPCLGSGGGTPSSTRSTSAASQDSNGDGVGDLPGIRSRLPYLRELGVDALWLTPFYPSPGADHGYDVADYVDVDPLFGTLDDFDELVADAHELGHQGDRSTSSPTTRPTSTRGSGTRSPTRRIPTAQRYMFRPGRDGGPPNDWTSAFGGPAWTLDEPTRRVLPPLLHARAARPRLAQRAACRTSFDEILRFWLDRGVDGFRIDVAHALFKAQDLREMVEPTPRPPFARLASRR